MFQKNISEEKKRKTRNVDLTTFLVFFMSHYRYFLYGCSSDPSNYNIGLVMHLLNHSSEAMTLTYLGLDQASRETMLDQIDFG